MSDGPTPMIDPAKAAVVSLLSAAIGPEAAWPSLRVKLPESDPGSSQSVAALIVPPSVWLEPRVV